MAQIRIKRGTFAQLNAAATAETLAAGEPYLVTDRAQLAVGTSDGAYALAAREADLLALRTAYSLGTISGAVSINLSNGPVQAGTLNGNVTFTLPAVASGTTEHLTLILDNSFWGGAPYAITLTGAAWVTGVAPDLDDDCIIVLRGTALGWIADGGIYG